MVEATKKLIANWKDFSGKTSRSDFWWGYLGLCLIMLAVGLVFGIFIGIGIALDSAIGYILMAIGYIALIVVYIAIIVIMISAEVRRIRDAGFPWWFIFAAFIPSIGTIALIVFLCFPSSDKPVINFGGAEINTAGTNNAGTGAAPVDVNYTDVTKEEAPVVDTSTWYCPNCGAENSANFCASCGEKKPQ